VDSLVKVTPDAIAAGYDGLADHWASDAFPRDNGVPQHQRAIAFVEHRRHAIDVGCGSSGRIVELLLGYGFTVEGVDLSTRMIELARRRQPGVVFHHADIRTWPMPHQYDLISAWDSVWHLPLADQEAVLRKLLGALAPGGVYIFSMGGLDSASEQVDDAMGPTLYYSTLGIPETVRIIDEAGCICRHLEYDQHPEPHVFVIAQRA
jgi:SAM-dependent methyltransferase